MSHSLEKTTMIVLYWVNKIHLLKPKLFAFLQKPPHLPPSPRENGQGHCHCSTSMSLPPAGIVCLKPHQATSCCTAQGEIEQGYPAMDIVVHARRRTRLKGRLLPILHRRRYGHRWQRYTAGRSSLSIVVHARRQSGLKGMLLPIRPRKRYSQRRCFRTRPGPTGQEIGSMYESLHTA